MAYFFMYSSTYFVGDGDGGRAERVFFLRETVRLAP